MSWETWRLMNMAVALAALLLHLTCWTQRSRASRASEMGFLSNAAWCAGYLVAMLFANASETGDPGPWTAVFSIPIGWAFAAGLFLARDNS